MKGMIIIMIDSQQIMFNEERKQKIIELLQKNNKVTVAELSKIFKVSSATIRNDLRELSDLQLLRRTHGGALSNAKVGIDVDPIENKIKNVEEKTAISNKAIELIEDGDTIIIDSGTTILHLTDLLHVKKNLTVVTNDLLIANKLEEFENINTIIIGGMIRKSYHCSVGALGLDMLSNFVVDKAFMCTNAISPFKGASSPDVNQAEIKKKMISISDKTIFLCDSSKIGKNLFINFAKIDEIDTIVTDSGIDAKMVEYFKEENIEVIIV
ncbi:MAG: DeoR/GlpR family DNA-binding transcription regulator [Eubacteriales bacterium]